MARVDERMKPIEGTERFIPCDCLILAVGLIPENELSRQIGIEMDDATGGPIVDEGMETSLPGIFACGNVVHVYDLVDDVTVSAEIAGESAAKYANGEIEEKKKIKVLAGKNVRYVVPQILRGKRNSITFYFRVKEERKNAKIEIFSGDKKIFERKERIMRPAEMVKVKIDAKLIDWRKDLWIEA